MNQPPNTLTAVGDAAGCRRIAWRTPPLLLVDRAKATGAGTAGASPGTALPSAPPR